jgi:predicted lactoylglutathione lyase
MTISPPRFGAFNLFVRELETLPAFYGRLLGFAEIETLRSPVFRALDAGGIVFGFNLDAAYDLLNLAARRPAASQPRTVTAFHTFEAASVNELDALARRAETLGARIIKPPYQTYYSSYQAVLADPEDNVFRLNHYLDSPWAK